MILLLSAVILGILFGLFSGFSISGNLITVLLMILVFTVGVDIGLEENILQKIKASIKTILIQSILTILGTLTFSGFVAFFTSLTVKEAIGAASGLGWYSLSGVMISGMYSPVLGAISFTSNVIREVLGILLIPIVSKFSELGAISIGGATSMDTLLGIISKNTNKKNTLVAFGQGVVLSITVPLLISIIFS
ncbi:membrane protein [Tepiditoga spiralis]|uniref:Membrane protein n=1 Tax=Tepiditoga spiralis TaxID=2108365 RepID=A0A7G1GB44_9BACT|nr:lysine exporter LysO family protein [Tepiditoga spiralis]BBE30839.1 membrane protein [Tepiditoga spiralis]